MKTLQEIGKELGYHANTIRNWLDQAGIKPAFLGTGTTGRKRGLIRIVDDEQEKQLNEWLVKRGIIN